MFAQDPFVQNLTTADGLPSNQVYPVFEDSRHFIWFATDAGVARYDGSNFLYLRKRDGLNSNQIIRIKEDSRGRIWFFNLNATMNFFHKGIVYNSKNAPFLDSLKSKSLKRDFYEDSDGTIYFFKSDDNEYSSLNPDNVVHKQTLPLNHPLVIRYNEFRHIIGKIIHVIRDKKGKLKFYTTLGLLKFNDSGDKPEWEPLNFDLFNAFEVNDSTVYFMVDYKKKEKFRVLKFVNDHLVDTLTFPVHLYPVNITAMLEEPGGYLWVATSNRGLLYLKDKKIFRQLDIPATQALICDHEGNVWTSSLKYGAFKIKPGFRDHIHYSRDQFAGRGITALEKHRENGIWCSNGTTVFLLQNGAFFRTSFNVTGVVFNQIVHLENNDLLIGEPNNRLNTLPCIRINQKSKQLIHSPALVSRLEIKKIVANRHCDEASSFYNYNLLLPDKNKPGEFKILFFPHGRIYNTFYNATGDLCINSRINCRYVNGRFEKEPRISFLDNKIITGHLALNPSTDLLNIEGDDLYLLSGTKTADLTAAFNQSIDQQIRNIAYDHPYLFLTTTSNVYIAKDPTNAFHGKRVEITPLDMEFNTIHAILICNDTLYIGSEDGLTLIPYSSLVAIPTNRPIPYFKNILINGSEHPLAEKRIQVRGKHQMQFSFGSINYSGSPVLYSYMMEGIDTAWKTVSESNIVFQNLPKGDYHLKLRVRKPTTSWSEVTGYEIVVLATLLQQPVFFVAVFLLITGIVIILVLLQKNRNLKRRETENQLVLLEQKALHSMMNPHFIFNTLGSIQKYLLQNQPDAAGLFLSQFARLIRQNITAINAGMTGLDEEIDRLKNYLELERLRMQNKFDYHIIVDSDVDEDEIMIPSMILQPIVENAIWHGVSAIEEQGMITISFHLHGLNALKVIICDNGPGIQNIPLTSSTDDKHLGVGMELTRKRLAYLGSRQNVKTAIVITEANPGAQVMLIIPFNYGDIV